MNQYFQLRPAALKDLINKVRIIDINQASLDLMEAASKEELKEGLHKIFIEDTTAAFCKELNVIAEGGGIFQYETKMKTLKGKIFEALVHINFPPANDSYRSVMVTLSDISTQKHVEEVLERTVQKRTNELQRSNQDLQQFGHVISHDLKEPVRKIITFANRIRYDAARNMLESVDHYIDRILAAGERMTHMIDGVLTYSMIDSAQQQQEAVNLNEVIEDIQRDLDLLIHEHDVSFSVHPLPTVPGTRIHLYQVFYNLINNSIKFRRKDVTLEITISSDVKQSDGYVRIFCRDNGIGFDPQHSSIIFKAFERLHSKSKYEGTGLGLALCQKIVERHGGKIEATGIPDEGAIFTVTLPGLIR